MTTMTMRRWTARERQSMCLRGRLGRVEALGSTRSGSAVNGTEIGDIGQQRRDVTAGVVRAACV
jgi:hypothetical protein